MTYIYNLQILTVKAQATVLWILKGNGNWYSQWIRRCSNTWAVQLVWKAHLCSAGESSQELDSNNSLITKLQPLGFLWILRCLDKWHLGGHWTVHLEAHPGSERKDESRWNTLRGTVEMNLFDIDHCWQFIIDMTKTYVFAHTEKFVWYILSSSASLSLVLVFYTSSGMLLTSELSVTEHLIWKYIRVVESKI